MAEPAAHIDPVYKESEVLRRRLLAAASVLFKSQGCEGVDTVLPGTSTTARDLVGDTFVKLLVSKKWHPGSGEADIYPFARVSLLHLFIDLLRRSEHHTAANVDPEEAEKGGQLVNPPSFDSPFRAIASKEAYDALMTHIGPADEKGRAFVEAIQNGATTRAEIAEDMGITVEEVTNIQKRLHYKLSKVEQLLWEFKDLL